MKKISSNRHLSRLRLLAVAALLLSLLAFAGVAQRSDYREERDVPARSLARFRITGSDEFQLIVELAEPSVIQTMKGASSPTHSARIREALGRSRMDLRSIRAVEAIERVRASQRPVISHLNIMDRARIQATIDTVLNAVIVRIPAAQYSAVARIPGVRSVHFSRPQRLLLDAAAPVQNASALWNSAGGAANAGRGVKIGIIDTGIDIDNPMFIDSTLSPPPGYPRGESAYTNSKVIVARNYVNLLGNSQTVRTAIDESGHGSFVAGCAGGKAVAAPLATISGMAPGAYLGNYKVFGTPGINDFTTDAAVIAAIDAAVKDGMDVLNLSLGSLDYVPADEDPMVQAIENAVAAGVVCVVSAGNEGPETHTLGNPGTAPSAITVGAATNGRIFATLLRVTAPAPVPENLRNVAYTLGAGPAITAGIPSTAIVDVSTLDGDGLGCSAFPPGNLNGSIAFIRRGACFFSEKVANAAGAGAVAAVIYNNVAGAEAILMGGLASAAIPAVMVSNPDGLALKEFIAARPAESLVQIEDSRNPVPLAKTPGVIAGFSSRGPSSDFELKPDLVAVGTAVYSAAQNKNPNGDLYSSTGYATGQGTSFSAPMVTGAAAALKALRPALTPGSIKSILVSTANREAAVDVGATADLLAAGAGMLDIGRAAAAGAVLVPSSLSFGVSSYSERIALARSLTISNVSDASDEYVLQVSQTVPGLSARLSASTTGTVLAGGTATVDLTISADAPLTGGFQGLVKVTSQRTSASYQVPYWAGIYVPDNKRILTVAQSGAGNGAYSNLADAVRAAQPGNVIEIADDAIYDGGMVISTNAQGLPLHGLTIRAGTGRSPMVVAPSATVSNIRIIGLRNVLVQGLQISGGQSGIELDQPGESQPLSATIDRCLITNTSNSGNAAGGVTVWDGATVFVTRTTISAPTGVGILVSTGAHLTMTDSTVDSSGDDGIDAFSADVQILRSNITNANGSGAYLERCSGTVEGSTFSGCSGRLGDGLEIYDGALTVSNCTLDSNEQVGIYLSAPTGGSGASGLILHNRMLSNRFGLYFNPGRDVRVEGNLIKNNGRGVRLTSTTTATLADNIVVRSTDAVSGDGIQVAGMANATLVNNTVYGNSNRGVSMSDMASVSIANCIIAGNNLGDLSGIPSGSVSYSLIGNGGQTSGNNVSGDPRFTNLTGDDYSLAAGSPAIDAGSNNSASLPFLDYYRMLRVASAGVGPGEGRVDMGAIESGSAYPLLFPLLANGVQLVFKDNLTTGLVVLNPGDGDVTALFSAFDSTGVYLAGTQNPTSMTFTPKTQMPVLGWQLFGFDHAASRTGSVLASAMDRLVGFFLVFDKDFGRIADGVDVSDAASTDLLLMRHLADAPSGTNYVVFNPGVTQANVSATLYAPDGAVVGIPQSVAVQPKGQAIVAFDAAPPRDGYVRVRSDRPVSALEFFGDADELSALRAAPPGTDACLYFPHFAVNGGFTTFIGIVNGASQSTDVTLSLFSSSGQFLSDPIKRTLAAGGQLLESVGDFFSLPPGPLTTGYIVGKSTRGGVAGFTSFAYESGPARSAAAVPAASIPARQLLFPHIAHQVPAGAGGMYQTGIALLNPFGVSMSYTMRVFDGNGNLVAETTDVLGPGERAARILSHPVPGAGFFTEPLLLSSGHVEIVTDLGLLGFELFFTEDFSQLASVPARPR